MIEISVGDREFVDEDVAIWVPLYGGDYLQINVTSEGIILDAYDATDECVGTMAMTFDEWHARLKAEAP